MRFNNIEEIVSWRICLGCGLCVAICPKNKIKMVNRKMDGFRPIMDNLDCGTCHACADLCPGLSQSILRKIDDSEFHEHSDRWGTVLEIWEGYASDPEIRYKASSGGALTALALSCIETENMMGVIHIGPGKQELDSQVKFSYNREELISNAGSRYSPATPCQGLRRDPTDNGTWVMIGKPCDAAGLRNAQKSCVDIKHIGAVISLFCAGTPSTQGTIDLLSKMKIQEGQVKKIRYRGYGWPGKFSVSFNGNSGEKELVYPVAWGFLQKYRQYRCYLCPDGVGEFADISCGDAWHRYKNNDELGYSLILIRTQKGREIFHNAIRNGYISASQVGLVTLEESQPNLFNKRAAVWGRILAFKILCLPSPKYEGFPLFENWLSLSVMDKIRSFLGTLRRILQRKYYNPI